MATQLSVAVRNAMLDAWETAIGTAPILRIYSGSMPANAAASSTGTLLAEMTLPSDWMAAASSGSKSKSGTWSDSSANASGDAGYFRIFASDGTTCHHQGTCGISGSGADMILSTIALTSGAAFTVNGFTVTMPNS